MAWQIGDYCTLEEVRQELGIETDNTQDDELIESLIEDASRDIDDFTGRRFYGRLETRHFSPIAHISTDAYTVLFDDDLQTVTSVLMEGDAVDADNYVLLPLNSDPVGNGNPKYGMRVRRNHSQIWAWYTRPEDSISVTGTWGYVVGTLPPRSIRRACIDIVRWRYMRRSNIFEQTGMEGDFQVPSNLPQDVQRQLNRFKKGTARFFAVGGMWD